MDSDPAANQWIKEAYAVALAASRGDESKLAETNDRIDAELKAANILFDPLMAEHHTATWQAWHFQRELVTRATEAATAAETLQAVNEQLQSSNQALAAVTAESQTRAAELQSATAALQSTTAELKAVADQLHAVSAELQDRRTAAERYREDLREREIERRRLIEDLAAQQTQIAKLSQELLERKKADDQLAAVNDRPAEVVRPSQFRNERENAAAVAPKNVGPESLGARLSRQWAALLEYANRFRSPKAVHGLWFFNAAYYLECNADVARNGVDPRKHFLRYGWKEGRSPHPLFDPPFYLENNPDVANAGANPVVHFLTYGVKENRSPNRLFDPEYYITQNPDVAAAGMDPIRHYIEHGGVEGAQPRSAV